MKEFLELFQSLSLQIEETENKFIKNHYANTLAEPEEYKDDVKAYCILAHAYLEEYFEQIALKVMEKSIDRWNSTGQILLPLLTLISYSKARYKVNDKIINIHDYLKGIIEITKKQFQKEIEGNHGTSKEYLDKLLLPIAINCTDDFNTINSLNKLAKARGSYAHKNPKSTIPPEDAREYVKDCRHLASNIKDQAICHFYENEYKHYLNIALIDRMYTIIENKVRLENNNEDQTNGIFKIPDYSGSKMKKEADNIRELLRSIYNSGNNTGS